MLGARNISWDLLCELFNDTIMTIGSTGLKCGNKTVTFGDCSAGSEEWGTVT